MSDQKSRIDAAEIVRRRVAVADQDQLTSVIRAAMSIVPIGGAIASALGDRLQTETQRKIYETMELLAIRLDQLEGRIDETQIANDEFLELFKSAYLIVVRSHLRERHIGAANLLANLLLRQEDSERLGYTQLDHFARCLESLSIGALECLATIYGSGTNMRMLTGERVKKTQFRSISARLPQYKSDLLMGTIRELDSHNLVHLPGAPDITTENYGNYPVYLTDIGFDFVERILRDFSISDGA